MEQIEMSVPSAPDELSTGAFAQRSVLWLLYLVPLLYVAYMAHVIVHEVLGHGLTALCCGGHFTGFIIRAFGTGWSRSWCHGHDNLVLGAGTLSEIVVGLPLMIWALLDRRSLLRRAALGAFAWVFLAGAGTYGFWGAYFARPPSDWGKILADLRNPALRLGLTVGFSLLALAAYMAGSIIVFRTIERHVGTLRGRRLLVVVAPFLAMGIALSFLLDWNTVIDHVGRVPQFGNALVLLAVFLLLPAWLRGSTSAEVIPAHRWRWAIVSAWVACAGVVGWVVLWGSRGVNW